MENFSFANNNSIAENRVFAIRVWAQSVMTKIFDYIVISSTILVIPIVILHIILLPNFTLIPH